MVSIAGAEFNLPLFSIPLYYILAIVPHGYSVILGVKGWGNLERHDNRNPRSTTHIDGVKRKLTKAEYAAWERAESCHRNHLENMPLFVAAVFAGLLAEQKTGQGSVGLNEFVVGWMILRVLYTINYIATATVRWSYLRSLLYFVGSFWAFYVIGNAAYILGN